MPLSRPPSHNQQTYNPGSTRLLATYLDGRPPSLIEWPLDHGSCRVSSYQSIYLLMAMNLLKLLIKAIDKRRRGFLWKGQEQANCGNCPIFGEGVQQYMVRWPWCA
jgi:hypothetical protein